MGSQPTIIPNIATNKSIAEKWSKRMVELPIKERCKVIIQLLEYMINGVYCQLAPRYDSVHLDCMDYGEVGEIYDELKANPKLNGLIIQIRDFKYDDKYIPGIEIRLKEDSFSTEPITVHFPISVE